MQPRPLRLQLNGREIHLHLWGDEKNPMLVCLHGLTRQGRDFDSLALHLSKRRFIICPDLPGRGLSEWSSVPALEYNLPFYAGVILELLKYFGRAQCDLVGTSMGGLLGLTLDKARPGLLKKFILNDVGPVLPLKALEDIVKNGLLVPSFTHFEDLKAYFKQSYSGFGPLSEAEWEAFTFHSLRRNDSGLFTPHFDPRVTNPFFQSFQKNNLWAEFVNFAAPTLVLRGAESELFPLALQQEMQAKRPDFTYRTFLGVGHAPFLNTPEQIQAITDFLL